MAHGTCRTVSSEHREKCDLHVLHTTCHVRLAGRVVRGHRSRLGHACCCPAPCPGADSSDLCVAIARAICPRATDRTRWSHAPAARAVTRVVTCGGVTTRLVAASRGTCYGLDVTASLSFSELRTRTETGSLNAMWYFRVLKNNNYIFGYGRSILCINIQ